MEQLAHELIEFIVWIDEITMEVLVEHRGPGLTKLMTSVTGLGSAAASVVFLILFHLADWREEAVVTAVAVAITGVVVGALMATIARPFPAEPVCITESSESVATSFPSGHAAVVCAYAAMSRDSEHLPFVLVASLATLVSVSRVYLGTHYLSDTVAGIVIGIVAYLIAKGVVKRYDDLEPVTRYLDRDADTDPMWR